MCFVFAANNDDTKCKPLSALSYIDFWGLLLCSGGTAVKTPSDWIRMDSVTTRMPIAVWPLTCPCLVIAQGYTRWWTVQIRWSRDQEFWYGRSRTSTLKDHPLHLMMNTLYCCWGLSWTYSSHSPKCCQGSHLLLPLDCHPERQHCLAIIQPVRGALHILRPFESITISHNKELPGRQVDNETILCLIANLRFHCLDFRMQKEAHSSWWRQSFLSCYEEILRKI